MLTYYSVLEKLDVVKSNIKKYLYFSKHETKRDDKPMTTKKVSFSSSKDLVKDFFVKQNVNLPPPLCQELLEFLSKACTYEEEEQRIRPSLIIGDHLLDIQTIRLTQATIIPFVEEPVEKTHLMKRLKSMLPFCNNGWRVFLNLDKSNLIYGIVRNFNGPSGLNIDDILTNGDIEGLATNFVLIDVASNFEIVLKGHSDICKIDFRLTGSEERCDAQFGFCQDLLSAYDFDISKVAMAYTKIVNLFPQKLHGSICIIVSHDYKLPDSVLKDGIFLETPIDIYSILAEDLSEKQKSQDISATISSHEKYHAFMGLLLEMLNIDGITVVDNKGRIRAYNVFVSPDTTGAENLSGGARKRAANYLRQQKNPHYIGVYFQSQDGMSSYERIVSNE